MLIRNLLPIPAPGKSLRTLYQERVFAGELQPDPSQETALDLLQAFLEKVPAYAKPNPLAGFFKARPVNGIQGFYLYGDVGRGKSMLMELLIAAAPDLKLRRVHFHEYMLEIQQRLFQMQLQDKSGQVMSKLARQVAAEARLLCFDEFHVNNIADAMILGRLFEALFDAGVYILLTSNWLPDDLYKGGLQRERFLPFIDLIKQKMQVHRLTGKVDHRLEYARSLHNYLTPLGDITTSALQAIFYELTDGVMPEALMLPVQGRALMVRKCAKGVAFFDFEELCSQPLSAADFLALGASFHTLIIDKIPILQPLQRNEAIRFMILIDALYESKTQIFMGAAASPEQLYPAGDQAFSFQRTASRLMEMQAAEYRTQGSTGC